METNWATEHLQVIRTLMERSAVYRRALAPIMSFTGVVGLLGAFAGLLLKIESARAFAVYWPLLSLAAISGTLLLVRRQALKESEPFWSPPTRRVLQAFLPPLTGGFILTVVFLLQPGGQENSVQRAGSIPWLPGLWILLYGCALHAAGFFMPRGMKMFGWAFVLGGCALLAIGTPEWERPTHLYAHAIMGAFFGAFHLAYGIYLYFTEQRKTAE